MNGIKWLNQKMCPPTVFGAKQKHLRAPDVEKVDNANPSCSKTDKTKKGMAACRYVLQSSRNQCGCNRQMNKMHIVNIQYCQIYHKYGTNSISSMVASV